MIFPVAANEISSFAKHMMHQFYRIFLRDGATQHTNNILLNECKFNAPKPSKKIFF